MEQPDLRPSSGIFVNTVTWRRASTLFASHARGLAKACERTENQTGDGGESRLHSWSSPGASPTASPNGGCDLLQTEGEARRNIASPVIFGNGSWPRPQIRHNSQNRVRRATRRLRDSSSHRIAPQVAREHRLDGLFNTLSYGPCRDACLSPTKYFVQTPVSPPVRLVQRSDGSSVRRRNEPCMKSIYAVPQRRERDICQF